MTPKIMEFLQSRIILSHFRGTAKRRVKAEEIESDGRRRTKVLRKLLDQGLIATHNLVYHITDSAYDQLIPVQANLPAVWGQLVMTDQPHHLCIQGVRFFELPMGQQKEILLYVAEEPGSFAFYLVDCGTFQGYRFGMGQYSRIAKVDHSLNRTLMESIHSAAKACGIDMEDGVIFVSNPQLDLYIASYFRMRIIEKMMRGERVIKALKKLDGLKDNPYLDDNEAIAAIFNDRSEHWEQNIIAVGEQTKKDMHEIVSQLTLLAQIIQAVSLSGGWVNFSDSIRTELTQELEKQMGEDSVVTD